jgi:hypothetical protein
VKYWLMCCDPKRYPLDERLRDPNPRMTWRVTRYHDDMAAGDLAFVWLTGSRRGIAAVLHVLSSAEVVDRPEPSDVDCVDVEIGPTYVIETAVVARGFHLSARAVKEEPTLSEMSIFSETQHATEYHLSRMEALKILELVAVGPSVGERGGDGEAASSGAEATGRR